MSMFKKITAVAANEFRLGIRRGWPVIATATTCLILSFSMLFIGQRNIQSNNFQYEAKDAGKALEMSWAGYLWLGIILLPMACAPSIPYDRQTKVHELTCSMPITGLVYLFGKLLGVWGVTLLTSATCFLLHFALYSLLVGPLELRLYLELILIAGFPLLMWSSAFGVLVAGVLPNRKMAIIIGLLSGALSSLIWTLPFRDPPKSLMFNVSIPVTSLLTRQQSADYVFYHYNLLPSLYPPVTTQQLIMGFGLELMILFIGILLVNSWLTLKEGLS